MVRNETCMTSLVSHCISQASLLLSFRDESALNWWTAQSGVKALHVR